jgi:hypothetical protein
MLTYTGRSLGLRPPEGYGRVETDGGYSQEYTTQGFAYQFQDQDKNDFYFIPQSAINQGIVAYDRQYYFPNVLKPDFTEKFQGQSVTLDQVADPKFIRDVSQFYEDTQGVIVPKPVFDDLFKRTSSYDLNTYQLDGVKLGPISGVGQKDGQNVYVTAASGRENPQGWIDWNADKNESYRHTRWYDPGNGLLRAIGYGLIAVGTGGLLGVGPLAASAPAAAGTGLLPGAAGTTGLLPSAAGVTGVTAPAGFTFAPSVVAPAAGAALVDGVNLSGMGQTGITPGAAGEGLLAPTTPGISSMGGASGITVPVSGGTVTGAGFIPAGAVPVLGDPSSFINDPNVLGQPVLTTETGMGVTDALRAANAVKNLLGAQQNPIVPQQARPQMAARGVDTLTLPQLSARTPGVASLLAPAQMFPRYSLLPNTLSLLG